MAVFEIEGGARLKGEITPQGAKNEALQVISAVLLTEGEVIIENIPDIIDVNKLIDLLADLGVKVKNTAPGTFSFCAGGIDVDYMLSSEFRKKGGGLRGSVMILGPLLARFGKAYLPKPGGDKIGRRRLDTHFEGFKALGSKFEYDPKTEFFAVKAQNLKGTYMLLCNRNGQHNNGRFTCGRANHHL
jgi:UDP-N-acetylglucosamine 1-carboxyvinyltransferase